MQLPVSACLAACLHYLYSKVLAHETSIALFKQDISETIWRSLAGDSLLLGWAYCIRVALQTGSAMYKGWLRLSPGQDCKNLLRLRHKYNVYNNLRSITLVDLSYFLFYSSSFFFFLSIFSFRTRTGTVPRCHRRLLSRYLISEVGEKAKLISGFAIEARFPLLLLCGFDLDCSCFPS